MENYVILSIEMLWDLLKLKHFLKSAAYFYTQSITSAWHCVMRKFQFITIRLLV